MEAENRKLVSPLGALTDVVLAGIVFIVFCFFIIPPHVPFYDPAWNFVFSAYTSLVMAGFAWLAFSLFRVTLIDQRRARKQARAG